jgi:plasmid stabilization system protein ParE
MLKQVRLTSEAQADIERIENYISKNYSVPNSIKEFRKDLEQSLDLISNNPKIGSSYTEAVRKWVRNHYIHLYVEYGKFISILKIAYERTNWKDEFDRN